jgi:hypothetical protein
MIYIAKIKRNTHFYKLVDKEMDIAAQARKGNVYIFKNVKNTYAGYWTCEKDDYAHIPQYIKKEDVIVRSVSLQSILELFVGINPTIEDIEKKLSSDLSCLLRIFQNRRDDTDYPQ